MLSDLIAEVRCSDPQMLATYVNYPTTEYLEPPGQDFLAFNLFLEQRDAFRRYVRHLCALAGEQPLMLTEFGLAADIHGAEQQAESLRWQLRTLEEEGCAGGTVFSWTDEWAVDDSQIDGWGFGVTDCDRVPKPALGEVREWGQASYPRDLRSDWPTVSVVVCARDEEAYLADCLSSLLRSDYPDLEVIVCDDGSEDGTFEIASSFPVHVISLAPMGLSAARNAGLERATGEIVAYLDADAMCHPEWPYRLVLALAEENVAAAGGPNLPFRSAGFVERAVNMAPGAAAEVLFTADRAEHVPGCNMVFEKSALIEVGGFDPAFVSAGDDVDVCWKLLDSGHEIGFSPAAQVHHHRRNTLRGYLRQQQGYGRAERMLTGAHPHRFNRLGDARWKGVVYRQPRVLSSILRPVVYTGFMGSAPFQPIASRPSEWVVWWAALFLPVLAVIGAVGIVLAFWSARWLALPIGAGAAMSAYALVVAGSVSVRHDEPTPIRLRLLVGVLHALQPVVRMWGRITGRTVRRPVAQREAWLGDRMEWLRDLQDTLRGSRVTVHPGPPGAHWDLRVHRGPMVSARVVTALAWQWEPRLRMSIRLRPLAWVVAASAAFAALGGLEAAWWILIGEALWAAAAAAFLIRLVERARVHTTRGSAS